MPRDGAMPRIPGEPAGHRSPRRRSLIRRLLYALFRLIRDLFCQTALGIAWLTKPFWSRADYLRWLVLDRISRNHLDRGRPEKAAGLAHELLSLSDAFKDDWNYGNAIHHGHLVLGRIALKEGDRESAREHLLAAGNTPGSPQLDSFGPNMLLAKEMLVVGEVETVLEYLELCDRFWAMGTSHLRWWTAMIRDGKTPNFGANLTY